MEYYKDVMRIKGILRIKCLKNGLEYANFIIVWLKKFYTWDKCSALVHWEDPEGWDGEGGGRGDRDGEHMDTCSGFRSMYGKNHYNIVK